VSELPSQETLNKWILAQRPPKAAVDPFRPYGFFIEQERSCSGGIVSSATILLTNKECPWRCLMCDLWKHTLPGTVPSGAIPAQIDYALARLAPQGSGVEASQIKLYNSGSFFDAAAIPPADYPEIAATVSFAQHVVVESHPRLIGEKTLRLRDLLTGSLEVALGLEIADAELLHRLNKRFTLEQFARACAFLRSESVAIRVFVLVKPPFVHEREAVGLAVRGVRFAFDCGADVVSLIPTRPGNGALERLIETGHFTPPRLETFEAATEEALGISSGRVFADTWDLERFASCRVCFPERLERLRRMNLSQRSLPQVACSTCQATTEQ
jgi:radical SAM enzyme (TIGR01210 family)